MNILRPFAVLVSILAISSAFASDSDNQFISANNENIAYTGRISYKNPESLRFTYAGTGATFNFTGTSLKMKAKPESGYFMVSIDGELPFKIGFGVNDSIVNIAECLDNVEHTANIVYAIEGVTKSPEFRGFYIDKEAKLLARPELPSLKMEFIGNSITCGYGIEAENERSPFTYETENHYYSFAALTARALNAQYNVVAKSGIGIYRNYGDSITGSRRCLPALYAQTLYNDSTEMWNFGSYQPDIVCVNLGTNDVSSGIYDKEKLTDAYRKFVKRLRHYYPTAKIVMLSGSMSAGQGLKDICKAMDIVVGEVNSQGDKNVYRFDMSPQTGLLGYGSAYHPSIRQARKMASELTRFLKPLIK